MYILTKIDNFYIFYNNIYTFGSTQTMDSTTNNKIYSKKPLGPNVNEWELPTGVKIREEKIGKVEDCRIRSPCTSSSMVLGDLSNAFILKNRRKRREAIENKLP